MDTIDKVLTAGLGALTMSRKKAEEIFDSLVKQGQAQKTARPGFVKDMLDAAEKTRKDVQELVSGQVQQALSRLDLATKEDISRLERKISEMRPASKGRGATKKKA